VHIPQDDRVAKDQAADLQNGVDITGDDSRKRRKKKPKKSNLHGLERAD
jgi:hypothetical protein